MSASPRPVSPLAALNRYIRETVAARAEPALPGETQDPDELLNARRFHRAWNRGRTLDQVEQALARKPSNAGPLNSHALVLQSLDLMRALSPDYLRRFVVHVEALQWLDQASAQSARETAKPAKPARRGRQKK